MISNTWTGPTTPRIYVPPVAGPIAWFNARAITGVAGGAALAQWDDLSGNANHVNGGVSPIYTLNVSRLLNLPGVVFNGTTQYLRNAAITAGGSTAGLTIIVALKMFAAVSDPFRQCVSLRNAGATGFWELRATQTTLAMQMTSGGGAAGETATTGLMEPSQQFILVGTHLAGGATTCQIGNGSSTGATSAAAMSLFDLGIGARANGTGAFWNSTLYEILIYDKVLSTQDKATVVKYLADDWSIIT